MAYIATSDTMMDPNWYTNSGATNHVTATLDNLTLQIDYKGNEKLMVGNGSHLAITHTCYSILPTSQPSLPLHLNDVL